MESRDTRKSFAHTSQRLRESRNTDNSLLSGPVEPIKMLFLSTSSGWERISTENNGRVDYSSKSLRPSYGVDSPNAMLKYACRNRAQERLQQGCNDKHAFPGGDLTRRDVPVSTVGCRSTRGEAPPPLVGSPDMPMPGIPVAEVRESVMISRLPSGPSIVEKKPSVTNLHGSRDNWARISEEASCSRKHGGSSYRHRDFLTGPKHDSSSNSVERTASSDLHSASSVFQTVTKALESKKRNKQNYDSSIPKKHLNSDHLFSSSAANPEYSSVPFSNRPDIQIERTNAILNNMNNSVFNSLSSIDEMMKAPDGCEYRNFSLHSNSSTVRVAQSAQHDLNQSVIKFEELIDVVSSTMTELQNISTSESFDSCTDTVPKRNDYRRYRQVQEVTSNVNCYVTTEPGLNPVSVSAFTTTTVTNVGDARRSNHSVGDSFLNDYQKISNDFSPHIDGCYKFNADESGDRNTRTKNIKYSSHKHQCDKDFLCQEEAKPKNICEKKEEELSKTLNKNQEVNTNERDKMNSSDSFSKEVFPNNGSKPYHINTSEKFSAKEQSVDVNETQEPGKSPGNTETNKSHSNVNYATEGLDTNASMKPETITQRQDSTKLAEKRDSVVNSAGVEKSLNKRLETRITKLSDQKFYNSTTPVEIAHSIISDFSRSIASSVNNKPLCQTLIGCNFEKNELKMKEEPGLVNNNDLSQNIKAKPVKSSDTSDFSDSSPSSPRKTDLESRGCEFVILDEKPQEVLNSDLNCVIQERTTTEKETENNSELNCKNTTEQVQTKTEDITEQPVSDEIKSERSINQNTNVEVKKSEYDKCKEFTGTNILQSLDRKVLDVMELVNNQLQKERTRQSSQPDSTNVRKKTQKNSGVRNDSGRFAKVDRASSRHGLSNKHLDSRSNKCFHRGNSSRRGDCLEDILRSRRKDRQMEIPDDTPGSCNGDEEISTSLKPVATLSVISEGSDVSKQPEPDQRTMLDTLVDNVTGIIKLKKFQMCLIDTLKNSAAESETQPCSKRVTRSISPVNVRHQRKSALPKSLPELDKEKVSSVGVFPTSARCSLMCQDTRVECIAPDLKKREEEIKKPLKPKETSKELNLKVNKIGISNTLITAPKRDNNREIKSVKNQARDKKCVHKCAKKKNLDPKTLKNTDIPIIDDKAESGSDRISPVGSSANVYDIKVNIINRSTSITNLGVEKISGTNCTIEKESCSQVINSSDENYESIVNSCESLNETSQDQITNREKGGKSVQRHYSECTSKIPPKKNGLIETEKNELHDSHPRKENLIQSVAVLIPDQSQENFSSLENVKPLVSNNDTKLIKSHSGNNNLCTGDKPQGKNNKSLSDSLVKDRKANLKRNIRITKCTLPTNSPVGDGELYHNATKVPDNLLKMKEQKRIRMRSSEKIKDRSDKHTKSNSRWTKPCNLEQTDAKTKSMFASGTTSFGVHKLNKLIANKPTTSSDRNETKGVPESHDFKATKEFPNVFEGYACGSYVKVDTQTCASEEKVILDTGGISKVHIKTNNPKQIFSMDESSHKPSCYEETNRKTKVLTGYSAALFIKPDGQVTEMNLGRKICSKRNCNCSKQTSGQTSGGCIQVEISQDTSSSCRADKVPKNENANNIHTNESIKDIISSKYSAVKLFFEKPPRSVEEKIISQVYYENGFISGNKSQPFDFVLNGFKFSDNKKIVKNKSSMMSKMNPFYDTDGLCLLSPEENNVFIDRNKIGPPVYKRGSSAQNRSASFVKEIPVIEKKLSTLIEILESLINDDDKHEAISYKSSTDNREETETLETKEDVSTEGYKKHNVEEERKEQTLECLDKSKGSTKPSEISRDHVNSEINSILHETDSKNNQFESDVSQTISTKGKCLLSEKILAADGENECFEPVTGEITKNIFSHLERTKDLSNEERIIDTTFSQSQKEDNIESNIDALDSENKIRTMNENSKMVNEDVNMPSCKNRSYELETLNAYEDETSMECTDSSNRNEVLNQSRRSSCSTLFSSCDSLTTNDYVEIFRGYIDGDNSTEKEVDLYDDSTESSNITENNTFIKQQLEEWKMNILRNKGNSQSSEVSYNLTAGRVSSSDSTAHYPSESEVSTYPRRISTQSSNISSLKKLYWTERNENKRKNNFELPDIPPEGNKMYSVAEHSQSKYMNTGNDATNYWTFDDYLRVDKNSPPGCSNRIGINVEAISEVTSSNLDREIFPSLSSIISKCVEETLNNTLRDITASIDFETYRHALSQKLQSYDSEHSSCQEISTNESHACETTDSDSNLCNRGGNTLRTTRIKSNPFSEDSNEYPSSYTNSHREIISSGYNEMLNDSSSNSEEDDSKGNCTSGVFESSQYGVRHTINLYRGVRTSATTWQRGPQKSVEEEENSQVSSQEQTSVSSENSEVDESSASHESLESVHGESPVAVLDLTSPETVTRVLDAMAHSEERQPIDDELEGEMGVFEYHDMPEFVLDESVIHASSDFLLPFPTEDSENTRSEESCSLSRLAEQYSAAVLTTRRTSSAWLEGTLRRLSLETCTTDICGGRRTREDRGGGALAISICICLFVFVCNRSFLYGDDDY